MNEYLFTERADHLTYRALGQVDTALQRTSNARAIARSALLVEMIAPISMNSAMPDRLSLDPSYDFIVGDDGVIELTEAGFKRMGQAHSAGLDAVIEIDHRELFRFPAAKP